MLSGEILGGTLNLQGLHRPFFISFQYQWLASERGKKERRKERGMENEIDVTNPFK